MWRNKIWSAHFSVHLRVLRPNCPYLWGEVLGSNDPVIFPREMFARQINLRMLKSNLCHFTSEMFNASRFLSIEVYFSTRIKSNLSLCISWFFFQFVPQALILSLRCNANNNLCKMLEFSPLVYFSHRSFYVPEGLIILLLQHKHVLCTKTIKILSDTWKCYKFNLEYPLQCS